MPSLTAAERTTDISMSDASEVALITTYSKTRISQLRRNAGATEVTTPLVKKYGGAEFRVAAKLVNIRNPRRASTNPTRPGAAERMAHARAARKSEK